MTKLVKPNNEVTTHQRSLQVLMVEVFKLMGLHHQSWRISFYSVKIPIIFAAFK